MKDSEKMRLNYIREYNRVIENTDIVSHPKTEPALKYDEKPVQPQYIELSKDGLDALRNLSLCFPEVKSTGRQH